MPIGCVRFARNCGKIFFVRSVKTNCVASLLIFFMDFVLQADAMRDQVGFPDYLVNKTKFAKRFKKYSNVSRKYNFV